jgi:hypothetical protein
MRTYKVQLTQVDYRRCGQFLAARNKANDDAGPDRPLRAATDQGWRMLASVLGELAFSRLVGYPVDWVIGARHGSHDAVVKWWGTTWTVDVKTTINPSAEPSIRLNRVEARRRSDIFVFAYVNRSAEVEVIGYTTAGEAFTAAHLREPKWAGTNKYWEVPRAELHEIPAAWLAPAGEGQP